MSRLAAQSFANPIAEERHGLGAHLGEMLEHLPNLRLGLGLRLVVLRCELDVELALVRTPGILTRFRAADLMAYGTHERQFQQLIGDADARRRNVPN